MMTPGSKWSYDKLQEIFERHATELRPVFERHPEMLGAAVDVDRSTDRAFIRLSFPEDQDIDVSDIPGTVGQGDDTIEVKIEYRPMARFI